MSVLPTIEDRPVSEVKTITFRATHEVVKGIADIIESEDISSLSARFYAKWIIEYLESESHKTP